MWVIWCECNSRMFKGSSILIMLSKKSVLRCLYEWMAGLCSIPSCQFLDFILFEHEFVILHMQFGTLIVYSNFFLFLKKNYFT